MIDENGNLLVITRHIRFRRIRQVEWTDDWRRWAGGQHRERDDGVLAPADPKAPIVAAS